MLEIGPQLAHVIYATLLVVIVLGWWNFRARS